MAELAGAQVTNEFRGLGSSMRHQGNIFDTTTLAFAAAGVIVNARGAIIILKGPSHIVQPDSKPRNTIVT